jgi:type IV pilus assembly protein PilM
MSNAETSFVGVDIGSTSVRVVKLSGLDADGFAVVDRFAIIPLRGDAVINGRIRNPQLVAQAIRQGLDRIGCRRSKLAVGATSMEAAVARLSLQAEVPHEKRSQVIRTLGLQVTPAISPTETMLATSFIREEQMADGRRVAALVVGATVDSEIELIRQVVKMAGGRLGAIDLAAAATARALVRDIEGSRDLTAVVDVGATTTKVVVREGLDLRSVRAVPAGGADLTRALAAVTKESFAEAERRKYGLRLPSSGAGPASQPVSMTYGDLENDEEEEYLKRLAAQTSAEQTLATSVENLVDQIAQMIEVETQNSGVSPSQLALCGGTSLTRGLKERLQRRTGTEVRIGQPWARLAESRRNADHFVNGREDPRVMLALATGIGLALRPKGGGR